MRKTEVNGEQRIGNEGRGRSNDRPPNKICTVTEDRM